jgi:hypothetical protein
MVDRVEIAVIDEKQPTWLAFLNGETDWIELPDAFTEVAVPGGRVAPHLARRGMGAERVVQPSTYYTMFNMEHPLVGGYAAGAGGPAARHRPGHRRAARDRPCCATARRCRRSRR